MKTRTDKTEDRVLKVSKDVFWRKNFDGTVAILPLDNDECFYTVDAVAAEFWLLVDGKRTVTKIKQLLCKKHKTAEGYFDKDVAKLLADLKKAGIL